ncbi:hypothetical protein G9A89_022937 [Geosiphon pyriformis]|nr:hypothetical protein G9A89_022937 [Geosiphon pyriformis]
MSKKKVLKGAFYGSAGGSFFQKKRVVLSNIKHLNNEKDIFLNKSDYDSMYLDLKSKSSSGEDNIIIESVDSRSLLGSAANTSKVKKVNTGIVFGSLLGSLNYSMDDNKVVLLSCLPIFLEKKWIDPKIIKTPVKVLVKKLFTLDINLSVVEGKSATAKTQLIRKIFSTVNSFGGATTPSKFEGIIQSTFTSKKSMNMTALLAREKGIVVNTDLKKQGIHLDWAVVIKKIPIDMPKEMIVTALAKFDSVQVAMAVGDCETWASRDWFRALLFTLPVEMTAHDLGTLLEGVGEKTCILNRSLNSGNKIHCAVVGFESEDAMEFAYCTEPIFGDIKLFWARLDLLVKLYAKKCVPISRSAAFSSKSWMQVVSLASPSGNPYFNSGSRSDPSPSGSLGIKESMLVVQDKSSINDHLALLKHSLELLADQIKWCGTGAPGAYYSSCTLTSPDTDMVLNVSWPSLPSSSLVLEDKMADLGLSSSKVLISKVGGLESKIMALELIWKVAMCNIRDMTNLAKQEDIVYWHKDSGNMISIVTEMKLRSDIRLWIKNKFDGLRVFTSDLDVEFCGAGVAIIMNNSLARKQALTTFKKRDQKPLVTFGALPWKQHSKNKFKVVTTPDATTLEYYQSIYTHCKQRFNIPDGIEVVKKSVYQYIENCINNYLFGNYNISEVKSNLYNNLAHYLQLETENFNSETLATYFQELNFNIIKYCEETYPVQSQYSIDFELETETSNKGKHKLKQYSKTTPNTPILPKTTAKHLQTPEQRTSSKLPLTITPFLASLAQAQTPNLPLN